MAIGTLVIAFIDFLLKYIYLVAIILTVSEGFYDGIIISRLITLPFEVLSNVALCVGVSNVSIFADDVLALI